jgi:hypothetical protein
MVDGNQQQDVNDHGNHRRASYPLAIVVGWRRRARGGGGSSQGGNDVT